MPRQHSAREGSASIAGSSDAATEWVEHAHGNRTHAHAHGTVDHNHMLRAVCRRPECAGAETHNIHRHRVIGDEEVLPYRSATALLACPECEEPLGSAEDWCWNCSEPVQRPVLLPRGSDYG